MRIASAIVFCGCTAGAIFLEIHDKEVTWLWVGSVLTFLSAWEN